MRDAVIVDAVRTPGGKRGGKLKDWHPVDLASEVLGGLAERQVPQVREAWRCGKR